MIEKTYISNGASETEDIAENFALDLNGGETILLEGEMGAGKTHFTKGIAKGLDVEEVVTSPTFAIHNMYFGRRILNHFDFYRITDPMEAEMLGLNEFFWDKNAVCVVEWGQNIAELLPPNAIVVKIEKLGDSRRRITIGESK